MTEQEKKASISRANVWILKESNYYLKKKNSRKTCISFAEANILSNIQWAIVSQSYQCASMKKYEGLFLLEIGTKVDLYRIRNLFPSLQTWSRGGKTLFWGDMWWKIRTIISGHSASVKNGSSFLKQNIKKLSGSTESLRHNCRTTWQ